MLGGNLGSLFVRRCFHDEDIKPIKRKYISILCLIFDIIKGDFHELPLIIELPAFSIKHCLFILFGKIVIWKQNMNSTVWPGNLAERM